MQIQHSHALLIYPLPKLSMTVCIVEFKNKAQAPVSATHDSARLGKDAIV